MRKKWWRVLFNLAVFCLMACVCRGEVPATARPAPLSEPEIPDEANIKNQNEILLLPVMFQWQGNNISYPGSVYKTIFYQWEGITVPTDQLPRQNPVENNITLPSYIAYKVERVPPPLDYVVDGELLEPGCYCWDHSIFLRFRNIKLKPTEIRTEWGWWHGFHRIVNPSREPVKIIDIDAPESVVHAKLFETSK